MFAKVFGFELRYQARQMAFWVTACLFFLFTFGATASDRIHIGDNAGVHKNSAYVIAQIHIVWSVFFMFVTTAFVANAVVRDEETGFWPIVRTTRLSKFDYLIGRFAGAFAAAALGFLVIPLAIVVVAAMPWLDPETIGPFDAQAYVFAYFVLALPNLFLTASAFFALACAVRSMMGAYLGVTAFLVLWLVGNLYADTPELARIAALVEPFGGSAYGLATKYWTATERNVLTPAVTGALLWNRVMVIGLGAGFLGLAYAVFRFEDRSGTVRPDRRAKAAPEPASGAAPPPPAAVAHVAPRFGWRTALEQLIARTRLDLGQVFLSPAFLVLLVLGIVNSAANLWLLDEFYGTDVHPVTRLMILALDGAFALVPIIVAIYYAGELVWRERDRRTHEIIDATPIPDWAYVAPKTLAISLVLVCALIVSVLTAVIVQALKGDLNFELGKYLLWYVAPMSIEMTLIATLAVFAQAVAPHKVIGWGLMVLYIVSTFVLPSLGLEHVLYRYASTPPVPLSDMNGQGRFWIGAAWLHVYWSAFALILLVVAYGLWRRGLETRFTPRLARLRQRLGAPAGLVALAALAVFAASGAYIFVNTNVWNPYRSQSDQDRWAADYEKALLGYETTPQPRVVNVKLDVDIHPRAARVTTRGVYVVENKTGGPLREIHVRFPRDLVMRSLSIEGARPVRTYDRFNYRIFAFDTPMRPGERRTMAFETMLAQKGFSNGRGLTQVVANGTFLNDRDIAPQLGMDRHGLLEDRRKRAGYGLPRELRVPALGTPGADGANYLGHDADWVTADIRVTTDADQTPVAPGYKVFERTADGRRTVEFKTEAPILKVFSIQSARYAERRELYKGVVLSVLYDPQHAWNVDRMIAAMKASLDYYQTNFSPYQFRQLRFLEFPDYARFAQSFANTVPWSEGLGFIADLPKAGDPDKIDYVTYVGAHEIAHQWWAHQIIGADEQGATALSETLAQYSALMVMRKMYGPDMIRRFLKYELDKYLRARGADVLPEQPLEKVEDQPYIYYNKGSLVMYRLAEQVGEESVNRALRTLLAKFAFKGPPYPTALDLVAALRAEAPESKQALITDLFEKITLYDLKAVRAVASKRPDGWWDVALSIDAKKLYADGRGKQTPAPLDEQMDVALFSAEPGKAGFDRTKVMLFQRAQIHSGTQVVHLIVDKPPRFAGVDPYDTMIDRDADDNLVRVIVR